LPEAEEGKKGKKQGYYELHNRLLLAEFVTNAHRLQQNSHTEIEQ